MEHPDLTAEGSRTSTTVDVVYRLRVELVDYEPRNVTIRLRNGSHPALKSVHADGPSGPEASPHRYRDDDSLCLFVKGDTVNRRWTPSDGLLALIKLIKRHLFKEAYWRETGEPWLGPDTHGRDSTMHRRLPARAPGR